MDNEELKKIDIKEFRKIGLLQEINRRFLHPLGLALEVKIDKATGEETLWGILDSRDDPEGFIYDLENSGQKRIDQFQKKQQKVQTMFDESKETRLKTLGYVVEPIPNLSRAEESKIKDSKTCNSCMDWQDAFSLECSGCMMKGTE